MDTIECFEPELDTTETEPLSPSARALLACIVEKDLFLTPNPYWRAVRPFELRDSLAPDWIVDSRAARELVAAGYIALRADIEIFNVYQHTEAATRVHQ